MVYFNRSCGYDYKRIWTNQKWCWLHEVILWLWCHRLWCFPCNDNRLKLYNIFTIVNLLVGATTLICYVNKLVLFWNSKVSANHTQLLDFKEQTQLVITVNNNTCRSNLWRAILCQTVLIISGYDIVSVILGPTPRSKHTIYEPHPLLHTDTGDMIYNSLKLSLSLLKCNVKQKMIYNNFIYRHVN